MISNRVYSLVLVIVLEGERSIDRDEYEKTPPIYPAGCRCCLPLGGPSILADSKIAGV